MEMVIFPFGQNLVILTLNNVFNVRINWVGFWGLGRVLEVRSWGRVFGFICVYVGIMGRAWGTLKIKKWHFAGSVGKFSSVYQVGRRGKLMGQYSDLYMVGLQANSNGCLARKGHFYLFFYFVKSFDNLSSKLLQASGKGTSNPHCHFPNTKFSVY